MNMVAGSPRPAHQSPAAFDCEIHYLPTAVGLAQIDESKTSTADLWTALAEAVMSEQVFDETKFERNREARLAEVVDLSAYRRERQHRNSIAE
jgi:hypothetical protein